MENPSQYTINHSNSDAIRRLLTKLRLSVNALYRAHARTDYLLEYSFRYALEFSNFVQLELSEHLKGNSSVQNNELFNLIMDLKILHPKYSKNVKDTILTTNKFVEQAERYVHAPTFIIDEAPSDIISGGLASLNAIEELKEKLRRIFFGCIEFMENHLVGIEDVQNAGLVEECNPTFQRLVHDVRQTFKKLKAEFHREEFSSSL